MYNFVRTYQELEGTPAETAGINSGLERNRLSLTKRRLSSVTILRTASKGRRRKDSERSSIMNLYSGIR